MGPYKIVEIMTHKYSKNAKIWTDYYTHVLAGPNRHPIKMAHPYQPL